MGPASRILACWPAAGTGGQDGDKVGLLPAVTESRPGPSEGSTLENPRPRA